jgi:hypothetical protein
MRSNVVGAGWSGACTGAASAGRASSSTGAGVSAGLLRRPKMGGGTLMI